LPNRKLSPFEIGAAVKLHNSIRKRLDKLSAGDPELLFALRRRLVVKLTHDERGTPAHRNNIKRLKRAEQNGICPICSELPLKYAELDRFSASAGYTVENTRLVHHDCHIQDQKEKFYLRRACGGDTTLWRRAARGMSPGHLSADPIIGIVVALLRRSSCVSVLNFFADDPARPFVRSYQNGLSVIKAENDIRSNECCWIIHLSGLKVRQQVAQPEALERSFGSLVELSGTIVRNRLLDFFVLAKDEASVAVNPAVALVVVAA
jgi:hypothetical protein